MSDDEVTIPTTTIPTTTIPTTNSDEMTSDELYSLLFDPAPMPTLTDDQEQVYSQLFGVDDDGGLTVDQAGDYLELFGDASVMGEPAVVDALEGWGVPRPLPAPSTGTYTACQAQGSEQLLGNQAPERPQNGLSPAAGTPDHPSALPAWLYPDGEAS